MKSLILALIATLSVQSALATEVLVISDIDDTLKVSHILSKRGALSSVFDDDSRFVGMAEVFQALEKNISDIEFHYVSLAPRILMEEQHLDFIEENGFPFTQLHTNPGIRQDPELKEKVIRQLISSRNPQLVLLVGDNGQFDAPVYDLMQKEFPATPMITLIREAYSSYGKSEFPTMNGQIGFVTSVEVSLVLLEAELLEWQDYKRIETKVFKRLKKEKGRETFGEMVFPWWQDCRDFIWQWPLAPASPQLDFIKSKISNKCRQ